MSSFKEDLKFGQDSEARLQAVYPFLQHSGIRGYDFIIAGTNIKVEKKSDSYDPRKYNNFIMERFSREEKPGGPWQSDTHDVDYFMYFFVQTNDLYVFDLQKLLARLEKIIKKEKLKLFDRWNTNYVTRYYKVPIEQLADLNLGIEHLEKIHKKASAQKKRVKK